MLHINIVSHFHLVDLSTDLHEYIDHGNSGSPIIQEQEAFMIMYKQWDKRDANKEGLIGIAISHFVSGRNNIGLGLCHSIDYVLEILESENMSNELE